MSYHLGSVADLASQASAAQAPSASADPFARLPASFTGRPSGGSFGRPTATAVTSGLSPMILLGGAALAAFLLLRKKGKKR